MADRKISQFDGIPGTEAQDTDQYTLIRPAAGATAAGNLRIAQRQLKAALATGPGRLADGEALDTEVTKRRNADFVGGVPYLSSVVGSDTITAVLPSFWDSTVVSTGLRVEFVATADSTGPITLNVSDSGARPVVQTSGEMVRFRQGRFYRLRLSGPSGGDRWTLISGGEAEAVDDLAAASEARDAGLDARIDGVQGDVAAAVASQEAGDANLQAQLDTLASASVSGISGPVSTEAAGVALVADGGYFLLAAPGEMHLYQRVGSAGEFRMVWAGPSVAWATSRAALATVSPVAGRVVTVDGRDYRGSPGATAIPDLPGWIPAGPVSVTHFGVPGTGNVARIGAAVAYVAANARALHWGEGEITIDADIPVSAAGVRNISEGQGPEFVLSAQTHGAFKVLRTAVNFQWYGNISARYDGVRTPTGGDYAGLFPLQRHSLFWIEADGFKHVGEIDTTNLFTSVCLRGPVKLRTGAYAAYADYAGLLDSALDFREPMNNIQLGNVIGSGQDFVVTGTEQVVGLRITFIRQVDQTFIQGIDPHAFYLTGKSDLAWQGLARDVHIGQIDYVRCNYSMAFKVRHTTGFVVGPVNCYDCSSAVMVTDGASNGTIGPVNVFLQSDRSGSAPTAPLSTAIDIYNGHGVHVIVGRIDGLGASRAVLVRGDSSCVIEGGSYVQSVDLPTVDYMGRIEDTARAVIKSPSCERYLPDGGTPPTTIRELFLVADTAHLIVDGLQYEGADYLGGVIRQSVDATAVLSINSPMIDGYDIATAVSAAIPANVTLTDTAA